MTIVRKLGGTPAIIAATAVAVSAFASDVAAEPVELSFFYHIDADMPEQDVFIVGENDSVFRVTAEDKDLGTKLYTTSAELHHNPFSPSEIGPHPKGAELEMTLGEWLGASGSGTYECNDGTGIIDVDFNGLVPGGVYTMWHFFMPMPVMDPFTGTLDLPFGARGGDDSVFVADANGQATFAKSVESCLQMSGPQLRAGLAIAYHSDGQTYGALPGEFGHNSHVQLFTMLPN